MENLIHLTQQHFNDIFMLILKKNCLFIIYSFYFLLFRDNLKLLRKSADTSIKSKNFLYFNLNNFQENLNHKRYLMSVLKMREDFQSDHTIFID